MSGGWQSAGNCEPEDFALFFGAEDETLPERQAREAQAREICAGCPVRARCRAFAEFHGFRSGVWAGASREDAHPEQVRLARATARRVAARRRKADAA